MNVFINLKMQSYKIINVMCIELQLEDSYTQEALDAEEREKDLRNRLAVAEETAMSSSSQMETARLEHNKLNYQ